MSKPTRQSDLLAAVFGAVIALSLGLRPAPAVAGGLRKVHRLAAAGDVAGLSALLDADPSYLRELAAHALGATPGGLAAAPALRACVDEDAERAFVRAACARALGRLGDSASVPVIAAALPALDPEGRYWAAEALATLGGPEARAALAPLVDDPDLLLSAAARRWLR